MTDLLGALVGRTLGAEAAVRPRAASRFERLPVAPSAKRGRGGTVTDRGRGRGRADSSDREGRGRALPVQAASPPAASLPHRRERHAASTGVAAPARAGSGETGAPSTAAGVDATSRPLGNAGAAPERSAPDPAVEIAQPEATPPRDLVAATAPTTSGDSRRDPAPAPTPADGSSEPAVAPPVPVRVEPRLLDTGQESRRATRQPRPPRLPEVTQDSDASQPVVHVHIGRIEVRAPARAEPPRAPKPREPLVSLDEYLQQTAGGRP